MTMGFVTGQPMSGQQLGKALFELGPSLPHEAPLPIPRVLARQLWPGGFIPVAIPPAAPQTPMPAQPVQPAQAPPGLPPSPQPRAVAPPPPPAPVASIHRPVAERRGM